MSGAAQSEPESIDPADGSASTTSVAERIGQVFAPVLLLGLAAGTVLLLLDIYPDRLPTKSNPGFIDTIFASKVVIVAARIALLFVAAYAVISVVGLIARRQFLTRVGPFQVSESVATFDDDLDRLSRELAEARETIAHLQGRVVQSQFQLDALSGRLESALARRGTIGDGGGQPDDA